MPVLRLGWVLALGASTCLVAPAVAQDVSSAPWGFEHFPAPAQAPAGAPNILVVLTDDVGFAASSAFGGPIATPRYDELATTGLRYNNFHTAAMCSPTRAALLTGRNHHRVGFGLLADLATDDPGYTAVLPDSAATFGRVLKDNGYNTSWFGKNHNTPPYESTPVGPFDRWPNGLGFDYFYGFFGGMTNQYAPSVIENRSIVRPHVGKQDYIFDEDMADKAIEWLELQESLSPDKPFLMYYAPGTAHMPAHAPKEWIEKFHGQFDQGWDKVRQETFERQKAMGIIPADTKLMPRPAVLPAWDSLTEEQKRISARQMETYAAQLAYFDDQFGRVVDTLKMLGKYENTLIIYVQGDNGASQEAGLIGSVNDYASLHDNEQTWDEIAAGMNKFGGPESYGSYSAGWAYAMNTPFQWSKQVASHRGGTGNSMVVSWPARIKAGGKVAQQFAHVVDIAPTIYEAIGITPPGEVDGVEQMSIDGKSFAYTFAQPDAPAPARSQYFELVGNRAFYKDGWMASTTPENVPWNHTPFLGDAYDYKWELYNLKQDFSQANDLAAKNLAKLAELKQQFDQAAEANQVLPLYADFMGRFDPSMRPLLLGNRKSVTFYPSDMRYSTYAFPNFAGQAWSATARINVPAGGADGTLVAQGGWVMGWGLFVMNGKPVFIYRASDHDPEVRLEAPTALLEGANEITGHFVPDARPARGGVVSLRVNGAEVASQHIDMASGFRALEAAIGRLSDEAITADMTVPFRYEGAIENVTITLDEK